MATDSSLDDQVLEKEKEKLKEPNRYTVLFHNDHYTTQEFVVWVLKKVFGLGDEDAYHKMIEVHRQGKGAVGNYSYDTAKTKAGQAQELARQYEFPLRCTVEQI